MTFYDLCFDEVRLRAEADGDRTIDFEEVYSVVAEKSRYLEMAVVPENGKKMFTMNEPKKPRKTRKDKGTKKEIKDEK